VYNFKEGILEERAVLEGHEGLVVALCYSKFRDYFVSGGKDSILREWERIGENQWENTHVLYNHNYSIEQIIFD
jgi:WD40 repeat protein